jgi:hypothetical protein
MLKISGGDLRKSGSGPRAKADARKNGSLFVDRFVPSNYKGGPSPFQRKFNYDKPVYNEQKVEFILRTTNIINNNA